MSRFLIWQFVLVGLLSASSAVNAGLVSFNYTITLDPDSMVGGGIEGFVFRGSTEPNPSIATGTLDVATTPSSGPLEVDGSDTIPGPGTEPIATIEVSTISVMGVDTFNISLNFGGSISEIGPASTGWIFRFDNFVTDDLSGLLDTEFAAASPGSDESDLSIDDSSRAYLSVTVLNDATNGPGGSLGYQFSAISPSAAVPEPSTFALIGLGLISAFAIKRRRCSMQVDGKA